MLQSLNIPKNIKIFVYPTQIQVTGSLGTLYINTSFWNKKLANLYSSLLKNAITGVSQGFLVKLKIQGSGYRVVDVTKNQLCLKLGYSHDSLIEIPRTIKIFYNKHNQILCIGTNKQELGEFCKKLQFIRKPNPYKAKGIFPVGKTIPLKLPGKPGFTQL